MTTSPCLTADLGLDLACTRDELNKQYNLALLYPFNAFQFDTDFTDLRYRGGFRIDKKHELVEPLIWTAPKGSDIIKGTYRKTEDEFGYAVYTHEVSLPIIAFSELQKRITHALDNTLFRIVLFSKDRTAEVYGSVFGMKTGDYEYNNKLEIVTLRSVKGERTKPLFYDGEMLDGTEVDDAFRIFDLTFDLTFE